MKQHYSDEVVRHSSECCSVSCLLKKPEGQHCSVYHFDTATDQYNAKSLDEAARMWVADGQKSLLNVGRVG